MTTPFLEKKNLLMTKEFKSKPGTAETGIFTPIIKRFY